MERSEGRGRREELQRGEEEMREDSRIPGVGLRQESILSLVFSSSYRIIST